MRTKRETQSANNANQGIHRGIRCFFRRARRSPFLVQWAEYVPAEAGGLRRRVKTEAFATADARDRRAAELAQQKREGRLHTANRRETDEWRAFQIATEGADWRDVVAGWRTWRQTSGRQETCPSVAERVAHYLGHAEKLRARGELAADTLRQKKHKLSLLSAAFAGRRLDALSAAELEKWIELNGWTAAPTFNNVRKIVRAFLSAAVAERVLPNNVCDQIKPRADSAEHIGVLTVAETARLFGAALAKANRPRFLCMVPRLALEAFAGLRFSSACRIASEDLRRTDRGVLLPAAKLKTKRRHYIEGLPENIWTWIALESPATWALDARQYLELKCDLFARAGVPHPHNALRHGFASYHVAAFKNPGLTAALLCHRNQQKLWAHYRGNVREADAAVYWSITPQTARRIAAK